MTYRVRVNGKVIEEAIPRSEVERRASTTWLKAQTQGLRVEVAESGMQNFRPLDQFLISIPAAGSASGNVSTPWPSQPSAGGDNQAIPSASTQRLTPDSFNNPTQSQLSVPLAQSSSPIQAYPASAITPVSYQNHVPQNFPPPSGALWTVVAETSRLAPALHAYIRPEHYGHNGPWLVRGYDLAPVAGFWICNAARSIDSVLIVFTLGIYLIFMGNAIAQGRQTLGQKLAGVRMVRQNNLSPAGLGQFLGSILCYFILSLIPFVSLLIFVQAFTEKKQGLNHMLCQVMHVEERHYDAGRGFGLTALGIVGSFIFWIIFLVLFSAINQ